MGGLSQPFAVRATPAFERLWMAQDGRCALCGQVMLRSRFEAPHGRIWAKRRASVDHILARAAGGGDKPGNLQLAHASCNKRKGAEAWPTDKEAT